MCVISYNIIVKKYAYDFLHIFDPVNFEERTLSPMKARTDLMAKPFSLRGVHVPHHKHTAGCAPVRLAPPPYIILPLSMHIGKPAVPTVKPGDHVDVGQLVASADGYISAPIYSGVSGTVKKCDDVLSSSGGYVPAIMVESDGLMTRFEGMAPPAVHDKDSFIAAIRDSGIVGLGGAGFPTYVKFNVKDSSAIEELIINGAECEPYITCDTRTMIDRADDVELAISLCIKHLGIKKVIIAIERNKPDAIAKMKEIASRIPEVTVKPLPASYPQGGEKVMIFNTTGKIVPPGKLPLDVGCIVCNCTTMAAIAEYVRTGMPLVEKCVTVDGGAVRSPGNYIIPIGTTFEYLFDAVGGFSKKPEKVLYGGPMMGIAVPNLSVPVLKNTNAVLALDEKQAKVPKPTACIRCGSCVNRCPLGLRSTDIGVAYKARDGEALKKLHALTCMECGCCAYVCPAKRPLVQTNRLAKAVLREHLAMEQKIREEAQALAGIDQK